MKPYGKRKTSTHVEGHQECGICHPPQKNLSARARREGKACCEKPTAICEAFVGDGPSDLCASASKEEGR